MNEKIKDLVHLKRFFRDPLGNKILNLFVHSKDLVERFTLLVPLRWPVSPAGSWPECRRRRLLLRFEQKSRRAPARLPLRCSTGPYPWQRVGVSIPTVSDAPPETESSPESEVRGLPIGSFRTPPNDSLSAPEPTDFGLKDPFSITRGCILKTRLHS